MCVDPLLCPLFMPHEACGMRHEPLTGGTRGSGAGGAGGEAVRDVAGQPGPRHVNYAWG